MTAAARSPLLDPARLAALRETALLDTPPEEAFDRVVRLAARLLGMPYAIVNLIDAECYFLKATVGHEGARTGAAEGSYCRHAVEAGAPLAIEDSLVHPLVRDNPAASAVRAYLGVPLVTDGGHAVGTLCVFGDQPRAWTAEDARALSDLAAVVVTEIDLRAQARRAEEARRAQEGLATELLATGLRFRAVTEAARDAIIAIDGAGRITFWSHGATAMFGRSADEVAGETLGFIMPERFREAHQSGLRRVHAGGEARVAGRTVELVGLRRDGTEFPIELTLGSTRVGQDVTYTGVIRDLTERHRAEAAVRESEERYRFLVEFNPDAVLVHTEGVIRYANKAAAALYGAADAAELVGLPFLDRIDADARPVARARVRAITERGEVAPVVDMRMRRLDGAPIQAEITGAPVTFAGVRGVQVVVRDVSARHAAEAALRESEAVYRTVVESLDEGLVITDLDDRVLFMNSRMCEITGHTAEEARGALACELFVPEEERPAMAARNLARLGGASDRYHIPIRRRDGSTTWSEISGVPLHTAAGVIVGTVATVTDISQRLRHERELVEARDAAEAASRAKSDFLARMSHELRTPLNSVIGFANVLARPERGLAERDRTFASRIAANGRHLLELINDVLDLSKVEAGRLRIDREPVDLAALVRETLQELGGKAAESAARLAVELPEGMTALDTDPSRLKQVLINLVGNALKFTRQGEVRVTVIACPATRRPLRIAIADTGIGIAPECQTEVFDAFEQGDASTSRRFGGTGLGLSISRALCDALGYRILLESRLGEGSTFTVELG